MVALFFSEIENDAVEALNKQFQGKWEDRPDAPEVSHLGVVRLISEDMLRELAQSLRSKPTKIFYWCSALALLAKTSPFQTRTSKACEMHPYRNMISPWGSNIMTAKEVV